MEADLQNTHREETMAARVVTQRVKKQHINTSVNGL